jgi:hypothetical protein
LGTILFEELGRKEKMFRLRMVFRGIFDVKNYFGWALAEQQQARQFKRFANTSEVISELTQATSGKDCIPRSGRPSTV